MVSTAKITDEGRLGRLRTLLFFSSPRSIALNTASGRVPSIQITPGGAYRVHVAVPLLGVRPRARQGRDQSPSTEQLIGNRPPRRDATGKRWPSRSRSHEEMPLFLRTFCPLVRSHRLGEAAAQGREHPQGVLLALEQEGSDRRRVHGAGRHRRCPAHVITASSYLGCPR